MRQSDALHKWLEQIGLAKYVAATGDDDIQLDGLREVLDTDVIELKITIGPRGRLHVNLEPRLPEDEIDSGRWVQHSQALARPLLIGERRQITVMFCDLVESSEYVKRLELEEWYRLLRRFHSICDVAVKDFGGRVAQYLGDGVLTYFGAGQAHEDDAERGVRAAFKIIESVRAIEVIPPLFVRCGVATGEVMIHGKNDLAVGMTVYRAFRLQEGGTPSQVCVCSTTRELLGSAFAFRALQDSHRGHSLEEPLGWIIGDVHRPVGRFEALRGTVGLTPFVGRDEELSKLLLHWRSACASQGCVVLISGEAGIGKSRLAQVLLSKIGSHYTTLRYQCSPHHTNSAFFPVAEHMAAFAGFSRDDTVPEKLDKLERELAGSPPQRAHSAKVLGSILSLQRQSDILPSPQKLKEQTLDVLVEQVELLSRERPVMLLIEDTHWIDPSTQELLEVLATRLRGWRVMVVVTHRPDYSPEWPADAVVCRIVLERLSPSQTAELIHNVAQNASWSEDLVDRIVARTDGIPLFAEEVTRSVLDTGALGDWGRTAGPHRSVRGEIPIALKSSLVARLDGLPAEKQLLQMAACIGRDFSFGLLSKLSGIQPAKLSQSLGRLADAGIVSIKQAQPDLLYSFKHALLRDVAYDLLLTAQRQRLHGEIAGFLSEDAANGVPIEPELLALHFTNGGKLARAIPCWRAAGELALRRFALAEAIAHFTSGLDALSVLQQSTERDQLELSVRELLNGALIALRGWASIEVNTNASAMLDLARRTGRSESFLMGLYGMWISTLTQGQVKQSLVWPQRLLEQAQRTQEADLKVLGHVGCMISNFYLGNLMEARRHGEAADSMYDPTRADRWVQLTGHDTRSVFLGWASHWMWMFGYPDQALELSERKDAHADRLGYALDIGYALTVGAYVFDYRREPQELARRAARAECLAREHGLSNVSDAMVPQMFGLAHLRSGDLKEGIRLLTKGIAHWNGKGGHTRVPYLRAALAEAHARAGQLEVGLGLIDECIEQVERPGWSERVHFAEILRLKAWMLMQARETQEAELLLRRALHWARQQQAKGWELRAATTLAELMLGDGRREAARELLQPVREFFREGLETPDLVHAAHLLDAA